MSNVYFIPTSSLYQTTVAAERLLKTVIEKENILLEHEIPLKVHFGEKGNETYIHQEQLIKLIDFLKLQNIKSEYIETNVLYRGERMKREPHIKLAKEHGFTALPINIADGEQGEATTEHTIHQKHIKVAKLASGYDNYNQVIVISHFKGHMMAGFGGALKQLSMGFASRAGKLDMHAHAHPFLNPISCKKCNTCKNHCPVDAIHIGFYSRIDPKKCIGCAQCIANCPYGVININWMSTKPKVFREKMVEYAYAAHKDRKNIYISFVTSVTPDCDCMGKKMKPIIPDIGVLASADPVALDKACYDLVADKGKKFNGVEQLEYAEKIGIGTQKYILIQIENKE
ncbi:DUF362 domain-containing protein [Candidatus Woesearchaeota archaeon]|nr:DUF362 domain-containing protein [Candidatus Woesearchaeota archaeon]